MLAKYVHAGKGASTARRATRIFRARKGLALVEYLILISASCLITIGAIIPFGQSVRSHILELADFVSDPPMMIISHARITTSGELEIVDPDSGSSNPPSEPSTPDQDTGSGDGTEPDPESDPDPTQDPEPDPDPEPDAEPEPEPDPEAEPEADTEPETPEHPEEEEADEDASIDEDDGQSANGCPPWSYFPFGFVDTRTMVQIHVPGVIIGHHGTNCNVKKKKDKDVNLEDLNEFGGELTTFVLAIEYDGVREYFTNHNRISLFTLDGEKVVNRALVKYDHAGDIRQGDEYIIAHTQDFVIDLSGNLFGDRTYSCESQSGRSDVGNNDKLLSFHDIGCVIYRPE